MLSLIELDLPIDVNLKFPDLGGVVGKELKNMAESLQAAAMVAGTDDIGGWIATHHDAPLAAVVEPDPAVAAAYDEAFAAYEARGKALPAAH